MTTAESTPKGTVSMANLTREEVGLATRNHGILLEALRYPVTPIGMHYLLTHYDVPALDPAAWTLEVGGLVTGPARLTLEDIMSRPRVTQRVTMECAGNGRIAMSPRPLSQPWGVEAVGTGEWTGTPLRGLLEEVGLSDDAVEVVFTGADSGTENGVEQRYERSLSVANALREEVMLVYELNGQPLPPQHGFPLRLVVPGWYGMGNVKWLSRITVVDEPFQGYQQSHAYRIRRHADEPGIPVSRIRPRALMIPPGIPDFYTRERTVAAGPTTLQGRAWSGFAPVERVEVSTDNGMTWADAVLEAQRDPYAWVGWSYGWQAQAGRHQLCCRATDADGNRQPLHPEWNLGGFECNAVQRVVVTVPER
ncbi:sulfite oxidase [Pseudonocardia hispaniensis]|uniref:Sulfite oxidase n=1 Tax=Pseudonocardia hispaniensis TaxID=904933 RepID=A0ABW1J8F5_9PSEU